MDAKTMARKMKCGYQLCYFIWRYLPKFRRKHKMPFHHAAPQRKSGKKFFNLLPDFRDKPVMAATQFQLAADIVL